MRDKLTYFVSLLLVFGFLAGNTTYNAPVQGMEIEVESEIYLRSQSFSHILGKKEQAAKPFTLNLVGQYKYMPTKQFSLSAQFVHTSSGNSLYLLHGCFLI